MPAAIIKNVKAGDLPASWAEKLIDPNQTFTVIIKPEKDVENHEKRFSLQTAMRGMEDEPGPEYSLLDIKEQWEK